MKKKHLLLAAVAIIGAVSCTKDEAEMQSASYTTDADAIGFFTYTTRVDVSDIADLESSKDGFAVYATQTNSDGNDEWMLTGAYSYLYDGEEWGWSSSAANTPQWPTDATNYPMRFYAIFSTDLSNTSLTSPTAEEESDTVNPITASVEILTPSLQTDLLATYTIADTKPSDGKLTLCFDHILSKIDLGAIVGYNKRVYFQGLAVNNLFDEGDYNIMGTSWEVTSTDQTAQYSISNFTNVNGVSGTSTAEDSAISITLNAATDEEDVTENNSLMLLPQMSVTAWDVDEWAADVTYDEEGYVDNMPEITGSYIEALYRVEHDTTGDGDYEDYIGYSDASDYDTDQDTSGHAGDPLFIKVGYPLSIDEWSAGKNYTYNLKIATSDATNGYLLDNVYYDENGDPTDILIDYDDKQVGDPISDGYISFDVMTCPWGDGGSSSVL